jgi:hypothetical protein
MTIGRIPSVEGGIQPTILDAKGDLIVATAADTPARLAVGTTNGHVLKVDSSTATGLAWGAEASPTFYGCMLSKSAAQSVSATTYTAITFDTETFDVGGFHSTSTNTSRITIPTGLGGYYSVVFSTEISNGDYTGVAAIYKNGSKFNTAPGWKSVALGSGGFGNATIMNLVAGDYIEVQVYLTTGANVQSNAQNNTPTWFGVTLLGV